MKPSKLAVADLPLVEQWRGDHVGMEKLAMPPDTFVVTRMLNGVPLSVFGEDVWTLLSGSRVIKVQKINFVSWTDGMEFDANAKDRLVLEMKRFFGYFLWFRPYGPLSSASLANKSTMLRNLARYALKAGISLSDVCSNENYFYGFLSKTSNANIVEFAALITLLAYLRHQRTDIKLLPPKHLKKLDQMRIEASKKNKQDPPLPTRLFSNWIKGLIDEMVEFEKILEELIAAHSLYESGNTGAAYINTPELQAYFDAHGFQRSWAGYVSALTFGQTICHCVMQTFSGMRTEEVRMVPYDCLEQRRRTWGKVFFIRGITTKGNGGGRETQEKWVSSEEGANAIGVAQRIADYIYKVSGAGVELKMENLPLFVSTGYLPGTNAVPNSEHGIARSHISIGNENGQRLQARMDLTIDAEDVQELQNIEPHRAWTLESRYASGTVWKVRSRQIRRSLAMYASVSGLVTLPALKWQLKHLTRDMTRYYTKGAKALRAFAVDNGQHFAYQFERTQVESQLAAYTATVFQSVEPLFGGHGTWIEVEKKKNQGTISLVTRKQTDADFKSGKIAFKETPMGGCTTVTPCEKFMLGIFGECNGCGKSVVVPSKVEKTIVLMERFVSTLEPGTLEYRSEMRELAEMRSVKANL